ncbi:hypothetical protein [Thiomicrospira microaerophila]|uniref:hypothetical protein n=1 Tax=Thiomicrospira microaerophila TaxID=406020 RepID=UPI0006989ABD|nr:hypothetical protein [Thiomicrospira microaerophila]
MKFRILALVLATSSPTIGLQAANLDQVKLVGIDLFNANQTQVRQHIRHIGGFQQERATFNHPNVDKFFPVSNLRDSYYLEFRYDANGQIVSAKRLYRRSGVRLINEYRDITTQDLARLLSAELGQPPKVLRKQREGGLSYPSYIWETEDITIKIDHRGSSPYQPIFVEYKLARDPFAAKIEEPENLANNRR